MGQRNPWTCDCCPEGQNAVCDTEHGYAVSLAVINASGKEVSAQTLASVPTLVSSLFLGRGRSELCVGCLPELVSLILRPTNSALSLQDVDALLAPVIAAIAAAGTAEPAT